MITTAILRTLLVALAFLALPLGTRAATLQARVTEVETGDTLIVSNINRQLKIRIKAIAPPESGQPFSDIAREHLKALVLDKAVTVDYTHLVDGVLLAKVIRDGVDVGAQMIRDGVAWYDHYSSYELGQADRDLYAQCEQIARSEHRGLWQDAAPVSPWDFHKAQLAPPAQPPPSGATESRSRKPRRDSLSNDDLMGAMVGPGSLAGNPSLRQISPQSSPDQWIRFQPSDQHFSILVPGNSCEYEVPVLDVQRKVVNIHYVMGSHEGTAYMLMWTRASNDGATDASAADMTVKGIIEGINRPLQQMGQSARATISAGRNIKFGGYNGKQYALSLNGVSAAVRVVSKQVGDQRELFMFGIINRPGEESSGAEFLNSFKIESKSSAAVTEMKLGNSLSFLSRTLLILFVDVKLVQEPVGNW